MIVSANAVKIKSDPSRKKTEVMKKGLGEEMAKSESKWERETRGQKREVHN